MDYIYKLDDMVCKELKAIAQKGEITNLDILDKLVHTMKGIVTIEAMLENEGSYDDGMSNRRGYSREGMSRRSYRGSYEDGENSSRRDRMGRYSGDMDDMYDRAKRMRENASNNTEYDALSHVMEELEKLRH